MTFFLLQKEMDPSEWHFHVMDNIRKNEAQKQRELQQQQRKARIAYNKQKSKQKEDGYAQS